MLTPEQIDALRDRARGIADPLNDFLLEDIARRISGAGQLTSTAQYQIWRMQQLGVSQAEIKKRLQKLLKQSQDEIARLLTQSAEVGYRFDLDRLPSAVAAPFEQNEAVQRIVSAAVEMAQENFTNFTQTLGVVDPFGHPLPLQEAYRSCMDFAFEQVSTGATDYNTAIRRACKNLAEKGVVSIDYESGVHTSLEAAVRRCVMGGLGLMQEQITQQTHDELGCDGWEITAHANSAPDHEPIQGKQYSDADYIALNNALVRRIGTLNCGHAAFPIILGISAPQYTDEELEKLRADNEKGFTYNGKHYTGYEAAQLQRRLESAMRRQKRAILVYGTAGDADKLQENQIKLQVTRQEYARFSKAAKLRTENERAEVAGFGRKEAAQARAAAKRAQGVADRVFVSGSAEERLKMYQKEHGIVDIFDRNGIKYIQHIDGKEIVVDAGKPTIVCPTKHAMDNLATKPDRANMNADTAQGFVDASKLTVYQQDRETLKFLADEGYAVLNLDHVLVTAVPQKWRKKYDKYLEVVSS